MKNFPLRNGFLVALTALLLSCGGGGGGGDGIAASGGAATTGDPWTSASATRTGLLADEGSQIGGPGDGQGDGQGGNASGATGGTTTASGGDDGSGVGSGGTGVSSADAGVGSADGAGSIFVGGLRYNTDNAVVNLEDVTGLQLGMSVKVSGPVNADFTSGTALRIDSAVDIRGPLSSIDTARGSFVILGTTVTTDNATVWADASGLAAIAPQATLQVWGLPEAPGVLRATRVEQHAAAAAPILTGTVQGLDAARQSFMLGGVAVDYSGAVLSGGLDGRPLANGTLVRVRANTALPGRLQATRVQWWYPVPTADSTRVQLTGIVTRYAGLGSLQVLGTPVDASAAQITGGPSGAIGNGVKLEVAGTMANGILKATKVKIRHVPGTGGPVSFSLIGTIGNFSSPSSFRVRGQPINASGPGVVFVNGSAANLGNGVRVSVEGDRVVDGVLMANRVSFNP